MEFENDVNRYGTQTNNAVMIFEAKFENDVNRYGTQTAQMCGDEKMRLRMM